MPVIHRVRENEYLDGDPPIFSCMCGFTGPRSAVDRHVADHAELNAATLRGNALVRAQEQERLRHELTIASITWSKADDAAEDAWTSVERCVVAISASTNESDHKQLHALHAKHVKAEDEFTQACRREHEALERVKEIAKLLTQALERS